MRRKILAVLAAAPLVLLGVPAAQASITPDTTVQIKNAGGGCLKNEGLGFPYAVASCSISSNFTRVDGHNFGGHEYYEYIDGNNECVTASSNSVGPSFNAGRCIGANTQLLEDPFPEMTDWFDQNGGPNLYMTKYPSSCPCSALRFAIEGGTDQQWSI